MPYSNIKCVYLLVCLFVNRTFINWRTLTLTATISCVGSFGPSCKKCLKTIIVQNMQFYYKNKRLLVLIFHNFCALGELGWTVALRESHECAVKHRDQWPMLEYSLSNMLNFGLFLTKPYSIHSDTYTGIIQHAYRYIVEGSRTNKMLKATSL